MGTQVLHPQDCLIERIRAPPAGFPAGEVPPATRPDQRNRVAVSYGQPESVSVSKRSSADDSRMGRSSSLASEKVTILRRGQSLDSSMAVRSDVYAGSAFAVSPSPSALPLPSFSTKKQSSAAFDDSATRDLRRLLRLE
ncbi:Proline-rich nuclear receptor coactivator motif [Sesbania bispinosa]|nr:Proline-rich nuclear receptor coactivator motif [Sesbania bispinosa]